MTALLVGLLVSLAGLTYQKYPTPPKVARSRNMDAIFWFVVGTLRECETAIDGLVRELRRSGFDHKKLPGWPQIEELHRFSKHKLSRMLRNGVAFHVDEEASLKGLQAMATETTPSWLLAEGDVDQGKATMETSRVVVGMAPLLKGLDLDEADAEAFISASFKQLPLSIALQHAFLDVLKSKNLAVEGHRRSGA